MRALPHTYIVAIGGLDPQGSAGLERDFLTVGALGASACLGAPAFTPQSPKGVRVFEPRAADALSAAVADAVAQRAGRPTAVKIGMVGEAAAAAAILDALKGFAGPVV